MATLLDAACCKRSATLLRRVAICWVLKIELVHGAEQNCCTSLATTTTSRNIHELCMKNLNIFKFEPTTPNMSQHIATRRNGWPNIRNTLPPTMLRYVVLKCCDRLAGLCSNTELFTVYLFQLSDTHFWFAQS